MRAFGRMYGGAMSLDDVSTYTNLKILYILTKYDSDFHWVGILVGIWSAERKTIKIRLEVPAILMPTRREDIIIFIGFVVCIKLHSSDTLTIYLLW